MMLKAIEITTNYGSRVWYADSKGHAIEQHYDTFGTNEEVLDIKEIPRDGEEREDSV